MNNNNNIQCKSILWNHSNTTTKKLESLFNPANNNNVTLTNNFPPLNLQKQQKNQLLALSQKRIFSSYFSGWWKSFFSVQAKKISLSKKCFLIDWIGWKEKSCVNVTLKDELWNVVWWWPCLQIRFWLSDDYFWGS